MINSTSPVQLFLDPLMDPDQRSISRLFRLLVTERNGIFRRCSVPFRILVTTITLTDGCSIRRHVKHLRKQSHLVSSDDSDQWMTRDDPDEWMDILPTAAASQTGYSKSTASWTAPTLNSRIIADVTYESSVSISKTISPGSVDKRGDSGGCLYRISVERGGGPGGGGGGGAHPYTPPPPPPPRIQPSMWCIYFLHHHNGCKKFI